MVTLPHDLTLEGDVIVGAAVGPELREALHSVDESAFYDPRCGRIWAAMRNLRIKGDLHVLHDIRIDGESVSFDSALDNPRVRVVRTLDRLEEALERVGSPNPRGDRRFTEQLLATALPGGRRAIERLVRLHERRRYISDLCGLDSPTQWRAAS